VPLRDKREALRVARHLSVALDRGVALMAKQRPSGSGHVMHCLLRYIEQIAADGTFTRTHEVQIDPDKLELSDKPSLLLRIVARLARHDGAKPKRVSGEACVGSADDCSTSTCAKCSRASRAVRRSAGCRRMSSSELLVALPAACCFGRLGADEALAPCRHS
jgi:hypothetical protein